MRPPGVPCIAITAMPFGSPHSATASVRPSAVVTRCSRCSGVTISGAGMAPMLAPRRTRPPELVRHVAHDLFLGVGLDRQNGGRSTALGGPPVVAEEPPFVRRLVIRGSTDHPSARNGVVELGPGILCVRHQPPTDSGYIIAPTGGRCFALLQR